MKTTKKLIIHLMVLTIAGSLLIMSCSGGSADLVIRSSKIVTMDSNIPEATALAVKGHYIIAVGNDKDISRYISNNTKVLEPDNGIVIPGLIESHAHFMSLGYSKLDLDLKKTRSLQDLADSVSAAVARSEKGEWIIGRGWHQERWEAQDEAMINGYPVHDALSAVSPHNPVYLKHASGHAVFVNERAMQMSGLSAESEDPPGGTILRKADGNPSGTLLENAADLVYRTLSYGENSEGTDIRRGKAFRLAVQTCLKNGITTFHDAGVSFETIDFYKSMANNGSLKIRLYAMINESNSTLSKRLEEYKIIAYGDNLLTVRAIKRFMDGALGSHGAWLFEPYLDMPESRGLPSMAPEDLEKTAEIALKNGFQLCTHAIGDRGNREVLDIYQQAFAEHGGEDLRWRIEHAQHLTKEDIPRFAGLGVIASVQTNHCTSDGPWVMKRLGAQRAAEGAYVWQKLMQSGAILANGTDAPVEDINPLQNFYSAVTRKLSDGTEFYPQQKMSRTEALQSYTINGAYAGFEENIKGSIAPGKLADLTILSSDIMEIPEESIPETEVVYTIVNGKIAYSNVNQ